MDSQGFSLSPPWKRVAEGREREKALQPALMPCQPARLDAVAGTELADRFGQVIPYRVSGQVQQRRDVAGGQSIASEAQYLVFAVVERIGFGPRIDRKLRIDCAAS